MNLQKILELAVELLEEYALTQPICTNQRERPERLATAIKEYLLNQ
jgi:hypothetical protein